MTDVMMDLETLGTVPGQPVLSIGLVYDKEDGKRMKFYSPFNLSEQLKMGMKPDAENLRWWMNQSEGARIVFSQVCAYEDLGRPNESVLRNIGEFLPEKGTFRIWGYGANFDDPMMCALYKNIGIETPWRYCDSFCFRTLKRLFPKLDVPKTGVEHDALADAENQYNYFKELVRVHKLEWRD